MLRSDHASLLNPDMKVGVRRGLDDYSLGQADEHATGDIALYLVIERFCLAEETREEYPN
jgi:hypothetical protein